VQLVSEAQIDYATEREGALACESVILNRASTKGRRLACSSGVVSFPYAPGSFMSVLSEVLKVQKLERAFFYNAEFSARVSAMRAMMLGSC
jgi:hypothetical protein